MTAFVTAGEREAQVQVHMAREIAILRAALAEAHKVILYEVDNGRTPHLLKRGNGGKGLGYLEDALSPQLRAGLSQLVE
jgi:hypothetical protein